MAGGKVADVQEGPGVAHERMRLALREEALRDATLIEHLDGARVKPPGSLAVDILTGASFDDDDVDPRQRQLGRQHQPGRTSSGNHHGMVRHLHGTHDPVLTTRRTQWSIRCRGCLLTRHQSFQVIVLAMPRARDPKPKTRSMGLGVALSNAMAELEVLLSPAAEHRIEEERKAEILPDQVGVVLDEHSGKVIVVEPGEISQAAR